MFDSISNAYHSFIDFIGSTMADLLGLPIQSSALGYKVDVLNGWVHWLMLLLFIGWGAFIIYVLIKFSRKNNPTANYNGIEGKFSKYLEGGIIAAEVFLLVALAIPGWGELKTEVPDNDEQDILEVRVIGQQFKWNFHYPGEDGKFGKRYYEVAISEYLELEEYDNLDFSFKNIGLKTEWECSDKKYHTKDECEEHDYDWKCDACDDIVIQKLVLPEDKKVKMLLSTQDVIHGFWLPEMRVKQDAIPGMEIPIYFTPVMTTEEFIEKCQVDYLSQGKEYRFGEIFTDENNNGLWDEGEKFVDKPDGVWNGEEYVDGNGKYDHGEVWEDMNYNGFYDKYDKFTDTKNGEWDEGESFTDLGDGIWNPPRGYEVICAQLCGSNHAQMSVPFEVLTLKEFNKWHREESLYSKSINPYVDPNAEEEDWSW